MFSFRRSTFSCVRAKQIVLLVRAKHPPLQGNVTSQSTTGDRHLEPPFRYTHFSLSLSLPSSVLCSSSFSSFYHCICCLSRFILLLRGFYTLFLFTLLSFIALFLSSLNSCLSFLYLLCICFFHFIYVRTLMIF